LQDYQRAVKIRSTFNKLAFKTRVEPHWITDSARFWYRNETRQGKEFILVDAEKGTRGSQSFSTPKAFRAYYNAQSVAELGFFVIMVDGLGMGGRSRAFHDVQCLTVAGTATFWEILAGTIKRLRWAWRRGDGGLPDHIAAGRQLAEKTCSERSRGICLVPGAFSHIGRPLDRARGRHHTGTQIIPARRDSSTGIWTRMCTSAQP
jgi:hypothetical protein